MLAAKLCVLVAVLVCNLDVSQACECAETDTHKQYCAADYVSLARIKGVQEVEGNRVYDLMRIIHFRQGAEFATSEDNKGAKLTVSTASDAAACGANLGKVGDYILVSGHVSEGKLKTTSCDWNSKFLDLPMKDRNGLFDGSYRNGCK